VNYVTRTRQSVVVHDAQAGGQSVPGVESDPHVRANGVRSVLCLPLISSAEGAAELVGVLYLENNLATHAFTDQRFGMLEIIGLSAAGRLELSRRAAVDGLTQLYNHEYFKTMLHQEVATARRAGRVLSVLLADIDHFKEFNDTWGHQLGDQVLREVSRAVCEACREADIVARYGGEELAIILPDTDVEQAREVAERIRASVEHAPVMHEGEALGVTISVGVAMLDATTRDAAALIRRADDALYASKRAGRNRVDLG